DRLDLGQLRHASALRLSLVVAQVAVLPAVLCAVFWGQALRLGRDGPPGHLGGLLLGRLLGAPLTGAERLAADPDRGAERLLVVRAALLDLVVGHAEHLDRGELLQR